MATVAQNTQYNQYLYSQLEDGGFLTKEALDPINDFTRLRVREEGVLRKIMEPLPIANDELTRQLHTDKPVKVVDKEGDLPPAASIPFGMQPTSNFYLLAPRYQVGFSRIASPRFQKDMDEDRKST